MLPDVIPVNMLEVEHSKELFYIMLGFRASNGKPIKTVHAAISPSGAKKALQLLSQEVADYEKDFGPIKDGDWTTTNEPAKPAENSSQQYTS
jgi:hypothetical protein